MTRVPCRRLIFASGHRRHAARYAAPRHREIAHRSDVIQDRVAIVSPSVHAVAEGHGLSSVRTNHERYTVVQDWQESGPAPFGAGGADCAGAGRTGEHHQENVEGRRYSKCYTRAEPHATAKQNAGGEKGRVCKEPRGCALRPVRAGGRMKVPCGSAGRLRRSARPRSVVESLRGSTGRSPTWRCALLAGCFGCGWSCRCCGSAGWAM